MRPPVLRVSLEPGEIVVDNFAGGGGASTGIEAALGRSPDFAINHDPKALAMHRANHPSTTHLCEDVFDVDPVKLCAGRPVGLAWFSPDCTFHSKARGGKPFRDHDRAKRARGLAWIVTRWARAVRPRIIILENVEEFQDWGPLRDDGTIDGARRGFTFRRWLAQLRGCGYEVEMRELRACDYGAPTIRKRLYIQARCDERPIVWPAATHGPGRARPYRTAAECIDWSLPCPSIFLSPGEAKEIGVRRPLADATLRRIARGIWKFVINAKQPFVIPVTHAGWDGGQATSEPLRTITAAHRGELALVQPFLSTYYGERRDGDARGADVHSPLPTQTTGNRFALIAPTLIQTGQGERPGQTPRALDLGRPLGTVVGCGGRHALVAAFLARHYGGHENDGATLQLPIPTITTIDHHAVVTSNLVKLRGTCKDGQPVTEPMPTVSAQGFHVAEVRAFLLKYYGTDQDPQLFDPMHTVTTRDRFGVVVTIHDEHYVIADIGMRMLTPRELARAQGFPDSYRMEDVEVDGKPLTKTAQTRMVGNSVCKDVAEALVVASVGQAGREAIA